MARCSSAIITAILLQTFLPGARGQCTAGSTSEDCLDDEEARAVQVELLQTSRARGTGAAHQAAIEAQRRALLQLELSGLEIEAKLEAERVGDCQDVNSNCPGWAASGECNRNTKWMGANCMKSCGKCPATGPACSDAMGGCPGWAKSGECQRNVAWMGDNCKLSCNKCAGGNPTGTVGGDCDTVLDCGTPGACPADGERQKCYTAVMWAMNDGYPNHNDWYPGLTDESRFDEFQAFLYNKKEGDCDAACPFTTTTTTTTTTTPPPGTPACPPRKSFPPLPKVATQYNGIEWPSMCFVGNQEEHVFLIGDWGGVNPGVPAPNNKGKRDFVIGLDDKAQALVAEQFNKRAAFKKPRYVLNVGDNFYWAGIREKCGKPFSTLLEDFENPRKGNTIQIQTVFEDIYKGPGVDGIKWLSCLGNHDYGGFEYDAAWDQQIAYTWAHDTTGRWVMPGQYYHQHIDYPTKQFSVDIYVLDTNNQDTTDPAEDPMHNICSAQNNNRSCAPFGPTDASDCVTWFSNLWKKQLVWLDTKLDASTADWQIIVTHFPPESWTHYADNVKDWKVLGDKYGIDLIVAGHRHNQELHSFNEWAVKERAGIPFVITGGGGGVTSENLPDFSDEKPGADQYGFMDMILTKEEIRIEGYNQAGVMRKNITVWPRSRDGIIRKPTGGGIPPTQPDPGGGGFDGGDVDFDGASCGAGYDFSHLGYWSNAFSLKKPYGKVQSSSGTTNKVCMNLCNMAPSCVAFNTFDESDCWIYDRIDGAVEKGGGYGCISDKEGCKDSMPKCVSWAGTGECARNQAYMESQCPRSCGKC